jgi:ABC-type phosphate/phosphonate transport system permease subunit
MRRVQLFRHMIVSSSFYQVRSFGDLDTMITTCLDLALLCHPILAFLTMQRSKMRVSNSTSQYWQYFLFSFLSILAIRYASTSHSAAPNDALLDVCQTKDQPNPIASVYPMNATGTLNGTIAVIPIPLTLARRLLPSQYRILEHAYRDLLPNFPLGMYPAFLQALHDHEVQAFGYQIPDFSVSCSLCPMWFPSLTMIAYWY